MGPPQASRVSPDGLVEDALQLVVGLAVYKFPGSKDSVLCRCEQRLVSMLANIDFV